MGEISLKQLLPYLILGTILGFSFLTAAGINAERYGSIYRINSSSVHNFWLSESLNLTFGDRCYNTEVEEGRYYSCLLNPINGSLNLTLFEIQFYPDFADISSINFYSCPLAANGSYQGLCKTGGLFWTLEGHGEKGNNSEGIRLSQNLVGFSLNGRIAYNYTLSVPDFSSYSQLYFPRIWFTIVSNQFWVVESPYHSISTTEYQPAYQNLSIYSLGSFQRLDSFALPYDPRQFNMDDQGRIWLHYSGNPWGSPLVASIYGYDSLQSRFSSIESTIQILTPIPTGYMQNEDSNFTEDSIIHRIFASTDRLLCSERFQNETSTPARLVGFRIIALKPSPLIPLGFGVGSINIVLVAILSGILLSRQKKLIQLKHVKEI